MGNEINIYETRTMMAAIEKMMPARTFFRDTFFPAAETYVTEKVDVDFKKGKRKMAPFVAPRVGGVTMDRQGYVTKTYTPPRIAPQRVLTKDDLATRAMGETLYSKTTPEQRAAQLLGKDLAELDEYITRREEWMCREILINGKVTMKGYVDDTATKTIDETVDFNLTNKEILTGAAKWDSETADPFGDLKRWRLAVIQSSGRAPNVCIMASDVAEIFIKNAQIQALFDKKSIQVGNIEPTIKDDAVTFIGKITALGLEVYSYDEWFLDDDGDEQPMMPEKTLLLARTGMGKRIYGAVTQMDESGNFVTIEGERVPKVWADVNNDAKMIRLSSRPLPVPEDVDDWFVAVVY